MRALRRNEPQLLRKLYRANCFGHGHMLEDNLLSAFPSSVTGAARDDLEALKREGIVAVHKTRHGVSVFIRLDVKFEVYEALRPFFPWLPP